MSAGADSGPLVNPQGPWDAGNEPFVLRQVLSGAADPADSECVPCASQQLDGELTMSGYQLIAEATDWDFYCVYGSLSHAVMHATMPYDPVTNWLSVGYYATAMSLSLTANGSVWDAGPDTTVGMSSTGFNIGGNLSGGVMNGQMILQGGVSAGFSASFESPDVVTQQARFGSEVRWDIDLPGVGGARTNPEPPSFEGYMWYFGAIFYNPRGTGFTLAVQPTVSWVYDAPRGTAYNQQQWAPAGAAYTYVPASTPAAASAVPS